MNIDYFRKLNNLHGTSSKKDVDLYNIKKQILSEFDDKTLAFDVRVNDVDRTVIIMDESIKDGTKKIISRPNELINFGDVVVWNDLPWIVIKLDHNQEIFSRGVIFPCVSSLKWLDKNGHVIEIPFTYRLDFYRGAGTNNDKIMDMPSERRYLYVQKNELTLSIKKRQRFIFDNRVWKLTAIDTLLTGIIYFELEENEINISTDNVELRIADYYGRVADYSVAILNGNYLSLDKSQTLQINTEVKNRDVVINNPILRYSVSDQTVASIDANGLLTPVKQGNVIVSVSCEGTTSKIEINITEVTTHNYTVEIIGEQALKVTTSKTYSCVFRNNGSSIVDNSTFILTGDDGTSPTELATIISQDPINNTCTIKAGKKDGWIKLYVRNDNQLVSNSVRIQIKPLY